MAEDPLSSKEAMDRFIQRAREAGQTDDQIREFVQKKRAERQLPPPFDPRNPPSAEQADWNARVADFYKQLDRDTKIGVASASGAMLGGALGEAVGAAIPAAARTAHIIPRMISAGMRALPEAIGEFTGAGYGAEVAGASPSEARNIGAWSAGGGMVGRTVVRAGTRFLGRMAKVRPETVRAGIEDPTLLREPGREAELEQAQRMGALLENEPITPAHKDYQAMLATKVNDRVDATPVLDAFVAQITGNDNASARAADRQVQIMADRFLRRVGKDGKISLGELDSYIRENFTKPLVQAYSRESEAETAKRMMNIRQGLTDYLYGQVGPQAAPAQSMAASALRKSETVANVFNMGTETRPSATGAERIMTINSDSAQAQLDRQVLQAYDNEHGTNLYGDAIRLSQQRELGATDMAAATAIDSALQPTRSTFVQAAAVPFMRGGIRTARVAGPVSAAGTAFVRAKSNKVKGITR